MKIALRRHGLPPVIALYISDGRWFPDIFDAIARRRSTHFMRLNDANGEEGLSSNISETCFGLPPIRLTSHTFYFGRSYDRITSTSPKPPFLSLIHGIPRLSFCEQWDFLSVPFYHHPKRPFPVLVNPVVTHPAHRHNPAHVTLK